MTAIYAEKIGTELAVSQTSVKAVLELMEAGSTIPFIARYRKEATGNLDEVAIASIRDRFNQLKELDDRRAAILKSLIERNLLTDELDVKIKAAETMSTLEDIYLPFRPKRRTRATIAKEKGLEPLAQFIIKQAAGDPVAEAGQYISEEKAVKTAEEALAGARDIIAEIISEDEDTRARLRKLYFEKGQFSSRVITGKETEGAKFKDYFEWKEPVAKAPSHRILAMRRGENEGFLVMRIEVPESDALDIINSVFVKANNPCSEQVKLAGADGFERLLSLSMETEVRLETKKKADTEAIRVFANNLREILMASPLGHKNLLALDPGFRTGCKTVCLDRQGKLLHHDVIYPHSGAGGELAAGEKIRALVKEFKTEVIAIGNGTAGRETETFVNALNLPGVTVVVVNESGASVYSASEVAREEFPNEDLTVRGAVSIGRRLMDPLAELVKIDPKAIGVGQYQHDVDQPQLKTGLDDVVVSCVNSVGVEVNTASKELLTYVSGLGPVLAKNIVTYRNENGAFKSRAALKKVPRLGPKAFEQCAGFLRIRDGKNPLDASAVHPERYELVEKIAEDMGATVSDLMSKPELQAKIDVRKYVSESAGMLTLVDIKNELAKPGRDPRKQFEIFKFADIHTVADAKPGMKVPGIVTNVTAFGAFVDIGVHQDGLVHVSEISDSFVADPAHVLRAGQKIMVTIIDVDSARNRIALSMKTNPVIGPREERRKPVSGEERPRGEQFQPRKPSAGNNAPRPAANRPDRAAPGTAMGDAFKAFLKRDNK
ncbi:MAG: Tex family protein [Elusimicrobiaceae bacterium]